GLVQRLINADLIGPERATALKNKDDLSIEILSERLNGLVRHRHRGSPPKSLRLQCAVQPPSTGSAIPVIEDAASEARKTVSAPSSSTVANFLFGCCASS